MFKQYFEEYQARLRTFTFETWPFKAGLSPPKLAQIGYCCKEGYLYCEACNAKFIIDDLLMPSDLILQKAFNSHNINCQNTVIKFKITPEYLHSYGLAYYEECLSSWKDKSIPIKKTFLDKIPKDYHYLVQDTSKILAIFGWRNQDKILVCKYCGRECELQNEEFDVFHEHRYFCKWANEKTTYKYGYMIVLSQLMDQSVEVKHEEAEYGIIRQTIQQQTEEIVKVSLQKNMELQNIKENIQPIKELLGKRKRFDIAEWEQERLQFEVELQKKAKLQKDQLEIQRQEQLKALYQDDQDDQEEIKQIQEESQQIQSKMNIEIDQQQNGNEQLNQIDQVNKQIIQEDQIQLLSDGFMKEEKDNLKQINQNDQENQKNVEGDQKEKENNEDIVIAEEQILNHENFEKQCSPSPKITNEILEQQNQDQTKLQDQIEDQINISEQLNQHTEHDNLQQQTCNQELQQQLIDEKQNIQQNIDINAFDNEIQEQVVQIVEKEVEQVQDSIKEESKEQIIQQEELFKQDQINSNELMNEKQIEVNQNDLPVDEIQEVQNNEQTYEKINAQEIDLEINNNQLRQCQDAQNNEEKQEDGSIKQQLIQEHQEEVMQLESLKEIKQTSIENDLIIEQNLQTEEQKQQINTIINLEEIIQQQEQQQQQDVEFSHHNSESPQQEG